MWLRRRETSSPDLHVVVGLGNPGSRFSDTRHNVGFMVVNRLAARHDLRFSGWKGRADVARGQIGALPVLLALPLTFMNDSGMAVGPLMDYYHVPPERLLVVADDLDLPYGTLRLRPSGSSGGQKGLRSIITTLHTEEFARLRVGIGRPHGETVNYVLRPFGREEVEALPGLLDVACDAIEAALSEGTREAMNRFNRHWLTTTIP